MAGRSFSYLQTRRGKEAGASGARVSVVDAVLNGGVEVMVRRGKVPDV